MNSVCLSQSQAFSEPQCLLQRGPICMVPLSACACSLLGTTGIRKFACTKSQDSAAHTVSTQCHVSHWYHKEQGTAFVSLFFHFLCLFLIGLSFQARSNILVARASKSGDYLGLFRIVVIPTLRSIKSYHFFCFQCCP